MRKPTIGSCLTQVSMTTAAGMTASTNAASSATPWLKSRFAIAYVTTSVPKEKSIEKTL